MVGGGGRLVELARDHNGESTRGVEEMMTMRMDSTTMAAAAAKGYEPTPCHTTAGWDD